MQSSLQSPLRVGAAAWETHGSATDEFSVMDPRPVTIFSLGLGFDSNVDSQRLHAEAQPAYLNACQTLLEVVPSETELGRVRASPDASTICTDSTVHTDSAEEDDYNCNPVAANHASDGSAAADAKKEDKADEDEEEEEEEGDEFDPSFPPPLPLEQFATPEWYSSSKWDLLADQSRDSKPTSGFLPGHALRTPGLAPLPFIQAPTFPASVVSPGSDHATAPRSPADHLARELCVKRTFLDFCPAPPRLELQRGSTAPAVPDTESALEAKVIKHDDEDEEDAPPPPFLPEQFATPEWYGDVHSAQELGWTPMPSLPEARWLPAFAPAEITKPRPVPFASVPAPFPACTAVPSAKLPTAPPPIWAAPIAPLNSKSDVPAPPASDANADYPCCEAAPTVPGLTQVTRENGKTYVFWAVDARKLDSQDRQAVSPHFELALQGEKVLTPFRMLVHSTEKHDGRRGTGFKKAKGKGRLELKCDAPRTSDAPELVFRFAIGRGVVKQPFRDEIASNFAESSCCGLPKNEEWHLSSGVDDFKTLLVILEVQPSKLV